MKTANPKLFLIELNEINFEFIKKYIELGKLKNFAHLLEQHGIVETESESEYEQLEPWIQWVTAHTGQNYSEHNVYRLGDITKHEIPQIWEFLEGHGLKVGAISPMNANNRLSNACFFIPDPWTDTSSTGSALLRNLGKAVSQAVNDNAQAKITPQSIFWLVTGAMRYARFINYLDYIRLVIGALRKRSWAKAQFLDLLLTDVMIGESRTSEPHFASLFLNAGAHIQHHYLFNSVAYQGKQQNPEWVVKRSDDPILDIYNQYDKSIGQIMNAFPETRLMIATGLHQEPYESNKYYWRLKDHESFMRDIGVPFKTVEPLMSRDFIVECHSSEEADIAQTVLELVASEDGTAVFNVDNRGNSLFVMLVYPYEITVDTKINSGNKVVSDFKNDVVFVAIKNGEHNGTGYFIDTGSHQPKRKTVRLTELPTMIASVFGLSWSSNLKVDSSTS